jgi:hypothetical protein
MKSQQEQEMRVRVGQVRGRLEGLAEDLRVVDDEVEGLAPQRTQHELLEQACCSLEKLDELGAASLFWGEQIEAERVSERLREVRGVVNAFQEQLDEFDAQRQAILENIGRENENLEILGEDLYYIQEEEERRKNEWIVERDISAVPRRVQRMAWARGGEDDKRFNKSLAASMLVSLLFGLLLPLIDLPLPKLFVPEDMPKRLARLVRPEQTKPLPRSPLAEQPAEQQEPEPAKEPEPSEQPPDSPVVAEAEPTQSAKPGPPGPEAPAVAAAPRKQVAKAGILAFKDKFASLSQDKLSPRLGADARLGDADDVSKGSMPSRSMLTSNAPGSSGGINIGSLSRNVGRGGQGGTGGGGGIHGVQVGRATSSINSIGGGGGGGGGRPRAGGGQAASRTDEEIQIVFDRYKASFYRLYNRELRNDPTLRGQMVLRLTIEPDGSVSMCTLQSSDMDAPDLADQVVARVRAINFGVKEDVQALTIVYPIDFLPKA